MQFPDRKIVERIKKEYPTGTKVELVSMNDRYRSLPPGLLGTVECVDDVGTIHVKWENGCHLGVAYGADSCRKVDVVKTICSGEELEWVSRKKAEQFFFRAMAGSEGSEQARYTKIFTELLMGFDVCTDEEG